MNRSLDHIDDLIGKYLTGEALPEEIAFVESWAEEKEENKIYLDQFRTIFQRAANVKDFQVYDTDAAWKKLQGTIKKSQGKTVEFNPQRTSSNITWWSIAASVALLFAVGIYFFNRTTVTDDAAPLLMTADKQTVTDTLPDGSDVVLNKATQLAYSFDEKKKVHTVKLKGEAYFNVQSKSKKNFVIEIEGVYVKDIGTAFNVKAYPESNTIEVVVEKGEVMFYTDQDSGVYLRENGKGIYNKTTKKFLIDQPEENVLSYKTRVFNFTGTSLTQVVEDLNRVYEKKIVLSDNLKNCHLTVEFHNESQEEIVAVISETLGLTVSTTADRISLDGPVCNE